MNLKITYETNPGLSRPAIAFAGLDIGYTAIKSTDNTMTFSGLNNEQTVIDFQPLIDRLPQEYIRDLAVV